MIAATLKVLTWGTVTAAVVSAALLTAGDGGMLRTERGADTSPRASARSSARASAITATPGPATGPAAMRNAPEGPNGRTDPRQ